MNKLTNRYKIDLLLDIYFNELPTIGEMFAGSLLFINLNLLNILTERYSHFAFRAAIALLREPLFWTDIFCMSITTGLACDHVYADTTHVIQTLPVTTKFAI